MWKRARAAALGLWRGIRTGAAWLGKRVRDAGLWLVNLIRDLPARLRRLATTLWEGLSGYHRIKRALACAERAAFAPDEFLRWLNGLLPSEQPEFTENPLTAEAVAAELSDTFRRRVKFWGG